jgi:hypothetical protein
MDPETLPDIILHHPLVSLVSACFWVICTWYSGNKRALAKVLVSVVVIMGQVTHGNRNNHNSEILICCPFVLNHIDRMEVFRVQFDDGNNAISSLTSGTSLSFSSYPLLRSTTGYDSGISMTIRS